MPILTGGDTQIHKILDLWVQAGQGRSSNVRSDDAAVPSGIPIAGPFNSFTSASVRWVGQLTWKRAVW